MTRPIGLAGPPIIFITGVMAAGKSTVAQLVAERLPHSVHLRGDLFRRIIVNGRVDMGSADSEAAMRQLLLRYRATAETAKLYSDEGFTAVCQDVVVGPVLDDLLTMYKDYALHLIVLCPNPATIASRERGRSKTGYGSITIAQLQSALEDTPRTGLWIDNSELSPEETAHRILERLPEAKIVSR